MNLTKPCKLAPRLEERAVAGCAADANSWLGLLPERVRAWRFRQGSRLASSVKGVARAASCVTRAPASRRGGAGGPSPPALNLAASAGKRVPGGGRLSYGSPFSRGRKPLGSSLPGCLRPGVQRGQRRVKTDLQRRTPAAPQGLPPGPRHVEEPQERTSSAAVRPGGVGRPPPGPLPPCALCGGLGPEL